MNFADALTSAMKAANLRDEIVAVSVGVSAQTVMKWRTGRSEPHRGNYDALREHVPGFTELFDSRAIA